MAGESPIKPDLNTYLRSLPHSRSYAGVSGQFVYQPNGKWDLDSLSWNRDSIHFSQLDKVWKAASPEDLPLMAATGVLLLRLPAEMWLKGLGAQLPQ